MFYKILRPYYFVVGFVLFFELLILAFFWGDDGFYLGLRATLAIDGFFIFYLFLSSLIKINRLKAAKSNLKNLSTRENSFFAHDGKYFYFEDEKNILVVGKNLTTNLIIEDKRTTIFFRHPMGSYLSVAPILFTVYLNEKDREELTKWFEKRRSVTHDRVFYYLFRDPFGRMIFIFLASYVIGATYLFFRGEF